MKTSEVKVGALTLAGAVILAGMISFLGAFHFFDRGYDLYVSYPSVRGLLVGNAVRYAGVTVGTVKETRVEPGQVVVTMHLNEGIQIPQEAEFRIGSDGVMGEKFVDVKPPKKFSGVYLKPGTNLAGETGGGVEDLMDNSAKVLTKLEGIVDALNNVFGDKEVQQSMRDGFLNARDISNNLNEFTKVMAQSARDNQREMHNMVAQLNQMSARMNTAMSHVESLVQGLDNNGQTGANVALMAQNLASTSRHMEEVSNMLAQVAKDPATKEDLQATLHNMRGVSERANKVLAIADGTSLKTHADVLHSVRGGDWRSNFGLTFAKPGKQTFTYLGASSIGDDTKLDLYLGKRFHNLSVTSGAMQGKFGVGLGYDFGDTFRLYSQLYDFKDSKLRLGGEVLLKDDIYLTGESLDLLHGNRNDVYLGVRTYF